MFSTVTNMSPHSPLIASHSWLWSLDVPSAFTPASILCLHQTKWSKARDWGVQLQKHPAWALQMAPSDWMLYLSIKSSSSSAGGLLACWARPGRRSAVSNVHLTVFTHTEVNTKCPFSSRQQQTAVDEPADSHWSLVKASTFFNIQTKVWLSQAWDVSTDDTTGIYHSRRVNAPILLP